MDKHNLIVIEGLDGSGKGTQTALLRERIISSGYAVRHISFPNYEETSAAAISPENSAVLPIRSTPMPLPAFTRLTDTPPTRSTGPRIISAG